MIYGAGCNIEFDSWKLDDVRGIRTEDASERASAAVELTLHRKSAISCSHGQISASHLVTHPPPYVLLLIYRISSSILSLPAPGTGYEDTLFFRMTRSPKD